MSIGLEYAAVQMLAEAIANANSTDPAAVRDAVWGQTFTGTVMGDVEYNDKGIAIMQGIGNEWLNEERALIFPQVEASKPLEWFVPWDQR